MPLLSWKSGAPMVPPGSFVALDFETADPGYDSACALSVIRVDDDTITEKRTRLIRPPRLRFRFTHIHGITWKHVQDCPTFAQCWPDFLPLLDGVSFIAAHNARFDEMVLTTCCTMAGLTVPAIPWLCSVRLARRTWGLRANRLPDLARHLGFRLKHHDPESDAEACARIVLAARAIHRSRHSPQPEPLPHEL
ncbi:MAG: 3'-5' exonuclease [Gemmataceae bacterium]|nr:3'-5' exonuclease [Gemmataceae bacterium]